MSSSAPSQLVSIPKGEGWYKLRLWSFGANWVGAAWGAELSAGGRDQVSSLAPASLRTASSARSAEIDGSLVFFPPPPRTQVLAPVRLGPRDPLQPEARGHGWAPTSPCPLDFPKPLPRGWTWRPGAKDCELGWPKEPELALGTSWATSPSPTQSPSFKDCLSECVGGVAALQTLPRQR